MTSTQTPVSRSIASTTSLWLAAIRGPAVPTAAIARAPSRVASSIMAAIALVVRARRYEIAPVAASPSPSCVTLARSTTARRHRRRCPLAMWNFTELVPTSIVA